MYPQSFKDRATRMVFDRWEAEDAPSRYTVIRQTAPKLSIAVETLRRWVEQADPITRSMAVREMWHVMTRAGWEVGLDQVARLMRTDPFREFDRLTQQILGGNGTAARPTVMPMDAWREGDTFNVEFDLPGVDTSSID